MVGAVGRQRRHESVAMANRRERRVVCEVNVTLREAVMFLSAGVEFAIGYLNLSLEQADALRAAARKIEEEEMQQAEARGAIASNPAPNAAAPIVITRFLDGTAKPVVR